MTLGTSHTDLMLEVSRLEAAAAAAVIEASAASHADGSLDVRNQHLTCPEARALLGRAHALRYRAEDLLAETEVAPAPGPVVPAATSSLTPRLEAIVAAAVLAAPRTSATVLPPQLKAPPMTTAVIAQAKLDAEEDAIVAGCLGISVADLPTTAAGLRSARAADDAALTAVDDKHAELEALVARIIAS